MFHARSIVPGPETCEYSCPGVAFPTMNLHNDLNSRFCRIRHEPWTQAYREHIPELSLGEHPLEPRCFLPRILNPILGLGGVCRPPADEEWRGIAAPLHGVSLPSRPSPHPAGVRGQRPRRGDVGRRCMHGCAMKKQESLHDHLSLSSVRKRAGEFWDDFRMKMIVSLWIMH
ncbi:hypothetical protein J2129_000598 [Methanofollis sp. W23]|nr:hypothetical protein [Methanofollis sp. W23]